MDGLASGRDQEAVRSRSEDGDVCIMPYCLIEEVARVVPSLQRGLQALMSREIGHGIMMRLGSTSAEERLAAFLLNLSRRYLRRGYSGFSFVPRMTRDEVGSYLGLKLETISRLFSAFQARALIEVQQREVSIVDIKGLERVLAPG